MSEPLDPVATLAGLRAQGGEPFDPVRLHYLEALARRTQGFEGAVKSLLEDKLRQALRVYQDRLAQHPSEGKVGLCLPHSAQQGSLADLTRQLTQQVPNNAPAAQGGSGVRMDTYPELKSVRNFRDTWSQLSVDKQLTQALAQAPENAGPLNSHQLVLRALSVMRSISPDYLNRFMSYVDALLWLDQADSPPVVASAAMGDRVKKRKASPPRAR